MNISYRQQARLVGILILLAYSMLTYTISGDQLLGVATDIISGLAVIGIPVLMIPLFHINNLKSLNFGYLAARSIEGH